MNINDFTIIVDTREQTPWEFEHYATAHQKLDTGDYSIQGLENIFVIERKKSVSEIANNITESRFKDVLERLEQFQHKFILLEFTLSNVLDYPVGSTVPKRMWSSIKITSKYILKYLTEINVKYGIHTIYCGNRDNAEEMAISIMKRMAELYGNK